MHGGLKIYRGSPAAARNYVEADRSRVDDYYLAEGTGVATRYVASPSKIDLAGPMDGDTYERWVAGRHVGEGPCAGRAKGRLRTDDRANRFVEITINGPKTWSLAAVVDPEIAAAYDRAQERAAQEVIGWLAQHATTRIGPRGRQVQIPVEEIEAAVIHHHTSRAGDPHRHLHVQINARVFAHGHWRGLHTIGVRDFLEAINGIGHAVVMTDLEFRTLLASRGFQVDADSGEIVELQPFVATFSARSRQIEQNLDRYEAEWRHTRPGQEPGPRLRQTWDRRAWAEERPDKVVPTSGARLEDWWRDELAHLGLRRPTRPVPLEPVRPGTLDRDAMAAEILTGLGARASA
ncbi:MobF family relaxase [Nocardioides sp. NPDC047086]|uniref:MobF family relaxase n=1 Tax=Nocardioides sp. NPDC047086 TaxID=3154810 RepID=UPI0033FC264E